LDKLALIASPVHRLDHHQAGRQQGAVVRALFDRIGDDRHAVTSCGKEVEGELVEEPLHPQQRGNMGFEVDAAGHVEELVHTLTGEVVAGVSRPGAQRLVYPGYAAVWSHREIAARCVLEQVFEFLARRHVRRTSASRTRLPSARSDSGNALWRPERPSRFPVSGGARTRRLAWRR